MLWSVVFAGEPPCKVALMQLCMDKTHCYLMHIIHSGVPPILKSLLEDSSSVKVRNYVSIIRGFAHFTFRLYSLFAHKDSPFTFTQDTFFLVYAGWSMYRQ
jgi:hypothetical protein